MNIIKTLEITKENIEKLSSSLLYPNTKLKIGDIVNVVVIMERDLEKEQTEHFKSFKVVIGIFLLSDTDKFLEDYIEHGDKTCVLKNSELGQEEIKRREYQEKYAKQQIEFEKTRKEMDINHLATSAPDTFVTEDNYWQFKSISLYGNSYKPGDVFKTVLVITGAVGNELITQPVSVIDWEVEQFLKEYVLHTEHVYMPIGTVL
jgi:hypothetical protein